MARISLMDGEFRFAAAIPGDWVAGVINAPLLADDRIATGPNSRAEVQFDAANMLRLGGNAEIHLAQLEYGHYQIEVARGTVTYRVLRASSANVEVDTPSISVRPANQGTYRITVGAAGDTEADRAGGRCRGLHPARLAVGARGPDDDGSRHGRRSRVPDYRRKPHGRLGPLERYPRCGADRVRPAINMSGRACTVSRISISTASGAKCRLTAPCGGRRWWVRAGRHTGTGRWVWLDWYGWTWVSYDPWGWAPYHYGRWFYGPAGAGAGIPAHGDAALLVSGAGGVLRLRRGGGFGFGFGFGNIGWVPLAPYEVLHPWWGRGFYGGAGFNRSLNVTNVNIANVYRNARVANGISGISAADFRSGRFNSIGRVSGDQMRSAGMVRGQMPMTPTSANLRFSDRQAGAAARSNTATNTRFFSHQQATPAARIPFAQQQRGLEQAGGRAAENGNAMRSGGTGAAMNQGAARQSAPANRAKADGGQLKGPREPRTARRAGPQCSPMAAR